VNPASEVIFRVNLGLTFKALLNSVALNVKVRVI